MPTQRYLPAAYSVAILIRHVLTSELNLAAPIRYVLTETREGKALLFAVMDETNIGKINRYTQPSVIHQLSTALAGRPVFLSNTTGLRYAVLLSPKRDLPKVSAYPGSTEGLNIGIHERGYLVLDPQKMQNALITGDMGSGKSNLLRLMALAAMENDCELYLADPEENTFGGAYWDTVSQLGYVAGSQGDFIGLLQAIAGILTERKALYQKVTTGMISPNSLDEYNSRTDAPLRRVIVIVDEANSYLDDKNLHTQIFDLARRSRKWGVNLILAAHSWRERDVSTSIRSMFMTRIALRSTEETSVRVVMGDNAYKKKVMRFTTPGRAAIRYNGNFTLFQTHLVPENYATNGMPALINHKFEALIRAAWSQEGDKKGRVTITFASRLLDIPQRQAQALCEELEAQGLAQKNPDQANARYLTGKALEIIGLHS